MDRSASLTDLNGPPARAGGPTCDEFFSWCEARDLRRDSAVAAVLSLSEQTVRNWRRRGGGAVLPAWVWLACAGHDALASSGTPILPPITIAWFEEWQRRHGLRTYDAVGNVFSIRRQAVFNWYKRGRFPKWLALACAGHDSRLLSSAERTSLTADRPGRDNSNSWDLSSCADPGSE